MPAFSDVVMIGDKMVKGRKAVVKHPEFFMSRCNAVWIFNPLRIRRKR